MAQVGKFLKAPNPNQSRTGSSPTADDQAAAPMLPVAGFLRRLGALIFDILFLFFFARIVTWAFGDLLHPNAVVVDKVATAIFLLYFALGASPAAKGRTLGKIMLGIQVTDLDGNVPKYHQALLRTSLLFPGVIVGLIVTPLFFKDEYSIDQQKWRDFLPMISFLPLVIAYSFAIAFNPFKQGCHDYISKTMVRPAGAPKLEFNEFTHLLGDGWKKFQLNPQLMAGATYILIFGLLMFQLLTGETTDGEREEFTKRKEILAAFEYDNTMWNRGVLPIQEEYNDPDIRMEFIANIHDEKSTAPIVIVAGLFKEGTWGLSEGELEAEANKFANVYHNEIIKSYEPDVVLPMQSGTISNFKKRPLTVSILFWEYTNLYFPVHQNKIGEFKIEFEPIDKRPLEISEDMEDEEEVVDEE